MNHHCKLLSLTLLTIAAAGTATTGVTAKEVLKTQRISKIDSGTINMPRRPEG